MTRAILLVSALIGSVCMARLNVYLPDELAERARAAKLNLSALTAAREDLAGDERA